jgi:hypothetical protein
VGRNSAGRGVEIDGGSRLVQDASGAVRMRAIARQAVRERSN